MTLTEYINQQDPQRLAPGSVNVLESEIYHSWEVNKGIMPHLRVPTGRIVELKFTMLSGKIFIGTYFVYDDGSGILWTLGDNGGPDRQSVFKLKQL